MFIDLEFLIAELHGTYWDECEHLKRQLDEEVWRSLMDDARPGAAWRDTKIDKRVDVAFDIACAFKRLVLVMREARGCPGEGTNGDLSRFY